MPVAGLVQLYKLIQVGTGERIDFEREVLVGAQVVNPE
jgi:hypothetical protein